MYKFKTLLTLLLLLFALSCGPTPDPLSVTLEYETLHADSLPNKADLNKLGQDGWQMIQLVPHEKGYVLYLTRVEVR